MRAEEQLKLAYMTIAELKDQNSKLVDAIAALERHLAESDGRDRRMVEEFYKGMIEDMRTAQEKELESMRSVIWDLTSQISALAAYGKVNARRLYGRKSEKSGRLGKRRDDDDRSSGKDNFNGTPGSDKGPASEVKGTDSGDTSSPERGTEDTVKALQKKLLRTHPGREMRIERVDYSKAKEYIDSPKYHKLEDYYELPEGAYFMTRKGKIDKNYVRALGLRMSKSTLGDKVHRAIEYMRGKMKEWWEKAMLKAGYWMIDETLGLVGCEDGQGNRTYKKKYFWSITAKTLKLSWPFYEEGSRGAKAIRPYLEKFIGFYTTDGYV